MRKKIIAIAACIIASINSYSQNAELKLTLRDGNILSGQSKLGNISLVTDYGKLEIPLKNVSSIDIGITPDNANSEKIIATVKQLSNSSEEMRKNAYDALTKMSIGTIPVINDFIYSEKYEPAEYTDYTAQMVLSELQSIYNVSDGYSSKDIVQIDYEYSMGGTYSFKAIDLKTEYGTLNIPKEKIKHIDVTYIDATGSGEKAFVLQANKHISGNANGGWLRTGIMVRSGQKLNISASGEITLASLSNGKYKPDGSVKSANENNEYPDEFYDGGSTSYPNYGNVVYRIGETGTALKAGAKFSGIIKNSGVLYISIYETVYNSNNQGSYSVKVSVK